MQTLDAGSVDAVVCDPPYGLSSDPDMAEVLRHWLAGDDYAHRGSGFMGKAWDSFVPGPAVWREAFRVLKPGGYLLAFAGSRTQDLMGTAIRLAGFEIRDSLVWQYGCLSDDSEALTRRGWVRGPELCDTDDVLQWDAATGVFAWARPSRIVVAPYAGPLVRLANRHTDQLLTPNHRVYARVQRHARHAPATDYEVLDAEAVGNRSSAWRVTLPVAAQLREGEAVDADYAYLVGWWLTDAWAHGDGRACMFSQSKPETLARLREALAPYGASEYVKPPRKPEHAKEHTFYLTGPLATRLLTEHPERRLTWDMLGWGWDARHALYRGLMDGDGSQPSRQHAHTFWSKNAERRDVFLALAVSLGYRAFIGAKDCVYVNTDTDTTEVQGRHRAAPVDYAGLVWCVTVPTGAFLARRNGRPFITGNSGFPKSLNVSIAIDKQAGAMGHRGKAITVAGYIPGRNLEVAKGAPEHEPITDAAKRWQGWGTALKPAFEPVVVARKPLIGTVAANVLAHGTGALNIDGCRVGYESTPNPATNPLFRKEAGYKNTNASDAGSTSYSFKDGSGERNPNVGGRWPANVILTHAPGCVRVGLQRVRATSGIRPDDVGTDYEKQHKSGSMAGSKGVKLGATYADADGTETVAAYECAPGCPVAALDAQSGQTSTTGHRSEGSKARWQDGASPLPLSGKTNVKRTEYPGDTGGASRFFTVTEYGEDDLLPGAEPGDAPFLYVPKANRSEREAGCDGLPARTGAEAVDREEGSAGTQSPRAGAGRTAESVRNHHPTVKPVSVMRWLCRLATAPGGVVLDPFMGSGTTGIAAVREGFRFVGIEREPEYLAIAEARIAHAVGGGFANTAPPRIPVRSVVAPLPTVKAAAISFVPPTNKGKEAPAMYVKSVESNVKKGVKADLGRLTLIVGPNGSGKSTVVNGIELALSGRASDVVGRAEVAKGIDLLALAPAADDALWSRVTLSDGRGVEWRCERNTKTGGAREATHTLPADLKPTFPVRQVREVLAGSPATVRAWLVGRVGSSVTEATIMGLIPSDLHGAYAELCRPLFGLPAEMLLDAREAAGKQARNAGADAKAANALAEQTGANIDPEPTDDEIERARQRVREAAVAASGPIKARPVYDVAALRAAAEAKVRDYATLDAEAQRLREATGNAPAVNADVVRLRDALTRVMVFTAQQNAADCLICGSGVPHGAHAAMLTRAEALTNAAKGDVALIEARDRLARVEAVLPEAQRAAQDAVMAFRTAADAPAEPPVDVSAATAALRVAEEAVRRLESARAAWANVRAAKARARDLSARQRLYADLHGAIEDAIGGVLERARRAFVSRVQSYLPAGDTFDLTLDDNGKDVCRFGLLRDGVLHTALSGAEWARLTLALAAAVSSDDEADLTVLTPEDRAFDADTLRAVMVGMSNAPGQVILCSPVAPAGRTPKGWTVIDLTDKPAKGAKKAEPDAAFDAVGEAK